jgi:hypothetical protein
VILKRKKPRRADMFVEVETRAGDPIAVGDSKIVPLAKVAQLKIPGWFGGVIWNRPVAVVIQTEDDKEQVVPVRDVTREAQLAIIGSGLFVILMAWLLTRRK